MKTIYITTLLFCINIFSFGQIQIGNDLMGSLVDDDFGYDVSISHDGNRVAIGAPGNIIGSEAGYVQVFERNGSSWTQLGATITGILPFNNAGARLAISGNGQRLILGSIYNNNGQMSGSIVVYEFNGSNWIQLGNALGGIDDLMSVGQAVAISETGNVIAFTTSEVMSINEITGHVDVFEWTGNNWAKRGNTFNPTESFDLYGYSIDLSDDGSRIAIGAGNGMSPITNTPAGLAHVFEYANGQWNQLGNNMFGKYEPGLFGDDVSLSGDGSRIIVSGSGSVNGAVLTGTVRAFDFNGNDWVLVGDELIGGESFDRFGDGIKLSNNGEYFVYGSISDGDNKGCAGLYKLMSNQWEAIGQKVCGDFDRDQFGYSVDLSADGLTVVTGARVNDNDGIKSGYTRVWNFDINSGNKEIPLSKITLYPNPVTDRLFVDLEEVNITHIRVFDINNRLVFDQKKLYDGAIDVSILDSGLYLLQYELENKYYNSKFIKM